MKKRTYDPLYTAWRAMRSRCNRPSHPQYPDYGGRGIAICQRWDSFANFAADMGPHPGKGWSLDRIDNNDGYRPGNCRWATPYQQMRNARSTRLTQAQADQIRTLAALTCGKGNKGFTQETIAARFGITRSLVSMIFHGKKRP